MAYLMKLNEDTPVFEIDEFPEEENEESRHRLKTSIKEDQI